MILFRIRIQENFAVLGGVRMALCGWAGGGTRLQGMGGKTIKINYQNIVLCFLRVYMEAAVGMG